MLKLNFIVFFNINKSNKIIRIDIQFFVSKLKLIYENRSNIQASKCSELINEISIL